jgi:hypothetical protein
VIFFKDLQHAEMREAASKSSTEGEGHTWPRRVIGEQRIILERGMAAEHGTDQAIVLNILMYWLMYSLLYWLKHRLPS